MIYWVYENWRAKGYHSAITHIDTCAHCKRGNGQKGGSKPDNGYWHGPYNTLGAAQNASLIKSYPAYRENCKICLK